MYSPSKRKLVDLTCYIQGVSPRKQNKHFRLNLQTDRGFVQAMCYDCAKYKLLSDKKQSRDPVKFRKILFHEDENRPSYRVANYIINKSTTIEEVDAINMDFDPKDKEVSYVPLSADFHLNDVVCVKALVDLSTAVIRTTNVFENAARVMNQITLSDSTAIITLAAWNEWIDELKQFEEDGKLYINFKNLIVREFNNEFHLSTCSETIAEPILDEDIPVIQKMDTKHVEVITTVSEFDAIKGIEYVYKCQVCLKSITVSKEEMVTCIHCGAVCRTKNLGMEVLVKVLCNDIGTDSITFNAECIKPYVEYDPKDISVEKATLIKDILNMKNIKVVLDKEKHFITILAPDVANA